MVAALSRAYGFDLTTTRIAVVIGAILLPVVLGFLLISQPNLNGGVGERRISPTTAADAAQREVLAAGELSIDLTHLDDSAANAARITVRDTTFDTDIATIPNQRQILLDEQEAQTASPITGISTGMAPVTLSWPRWDLGPPPCCGRGASA